MLETRFKGSKVPSQMSAMPGNALLQLDAPASVLADLVPELDDAGYGRHLCLLASKRVVFLQPASFTSKDK